MLSNCRLCGSENLELYYTQGDNDQYKFYKCLHCKLVNYDLCTGLHQEKYARSPIDPGDRKHKQNRGQTETYHFIERYVGKPGKLLDIGCGNGRLLFLAQKKGWSVKGLELSGFLADSVKQATGIEVEVCNFLAYKMGKNELFDMVVLRHVLEHLPDPILAMNKVHSLLNLDGYAVLEFPNIEGLDLKFKRFLGRIGLHKKSYLSHYKPGHCQEFCKDSFEFLLAETGFRLERWRTYSSKACFRYFNFNRGNKARVLIRKCVSSERASHDPKLMA